MFIALQYCYYTVYSFLVKIVITAQNIIYPLKPGYALNWQIVNRAKHEVQPVDESQMLTSFLKKESTSVILDPLNVTGDFTSTKAVILNCPTNVYDVGKHPFFHHAIFKEAKQKTTILLEDFHAVVDAQPWPEVRLVFLWSVGRCGSTLLANLFTSFSGFQTISEPDDIFQRIFRLKDKLSEEQYNKLLKNSLKYHLIQVSSRFPGTKYVIIKPRSAAFWYIVKTPAEFADKVTHIFMYRDVYPVLKSYISAFGVFLNRNADSFVAKFIGIEKRQDSIWAPMKTVFNESSPLKETDKIISTLKGESNHLLARGAFSGIPHCHALYRHLVNSGQFASDKLFAVKYEHLTADPVAMFEKIASKMNTGFSISETEKQRLVELSKNDSQKNSHINKGSVKTRRVEISDDLKAAFEKMMGETGQAGDLQEGFVLPNTV